MERAAVYNDDWKRNFTCTHTHTHTHNPCVFVSVFVFAALCMSLSEYFITTMTVSIFTHTTLAKLTSVKRL